MNKKDKNLVDKIKFEFKHEGDSFINLILNELECEEKEKGKGIKDVKKYLNEIIEYHRDTLNLLESLIK